jgi:hypothetical protein
MQLIKLSIMMTGALHILAGAVVDAFPLLSPSHSPLTHAEDAAPEGRKYRPVTDSLLSYDGSGYTVSIDPVYGITFSSPRVFILTAHKDQYGDIFSVHSACFTTSFQVYTRRFEKEPSDFTEKHMTDYIFSLTLASDIAAEDAATSIVSYPDVDPVCGDTSNALFVSDHSVCQCLFGHLAGTALERIRTDLGAGLV